MSTQTEKWTTLENQLLGQIAKKDEKLAKIHGFLVFCLGLPEKLSFDQLAESLTEFDLDDEMMKTVSGLWEELWVNAEAGIIPLPPKNRQCLDETVNFEDLYNSIMKNWAEGFIAAEEIWGEKWDLWLEEYGGEEDEEEEVPEDTLDVLFLFLSFWADREWTYSQWDKVWRRVLELDWPTFNEDNREGFINSLMDWYEFGCMGREMADKGEIES